MSFDNALGAITADDDDARWAFGTGFHDPLAGVDTGVPADLAPATTADLAAYCLMLGDDALIMSHRLQQWLTHAPELEEEVALANIALDLLGQARLLLTRAGQVDGSGRDEDDLAYFRDAADFRNVRLVEEHDGDFAFAMLRLLMFTTWRLALLHRLTESRDPVLAAVAAKGVKEVAYHRDHAALWTVRLGDGTAESRARMLRALSAVWPLTDELFRTTAIERRIAEAGLGVDPATLRPEFDAVLTDVMTAATLPGPDDPDVRAWRRAGTDRDGGGGPDGRGGRDGVHTPALTEVLAELQGVARQHPGATW